MIKLKLKRISMSYKRNFIILLLSFIFFSAFSQDEIVKDSIAYSMEEALRSPLDIKVLDLQKQKLKELDDRFDKLVNLHTLYLDKNKLENLPPSLSSCKKLRFISFSNNYFLNFPDVICRLEELRVIDFSNNEIPTLPECLKNLIHLNTILMVGNEVSKIPISLKDLDIIELDMRMIQMNEKEQQNIRSLYPIALIKFSKGCNCFNEEEGDERMINETD